MRLKGLLLLLIGIYVCNPLYGQFGKMEKKEEEKVERVEKHIGFYMDNFKSQKSSETLKYLQERKKTADGQQVPIAEKTIQDHQTTDAVSDIGVSPLSGSQIKGLAREAVKAGRIRLQFGSKASVQDMDRVKTIYENQYKFFTEYKDGQFELQAKRKNRLTGQSRFDSRIEVRQLNPLVDWQNAILTRAGSVGLIIKKHDLMKVSDSLYKIDLNVTLAKKFNLCASEPFGSQPVAGNGTGILIGDQEILTAGHVFEGPVTDYALVFGFEMENTGGNYESFIDADNVYGFKKLLHVNAELDIAHASLDRKCNRPALKLSANQDVKLNTEVYMIGFPSGLPQKVTANAGVYKNSDRHCFYTSLDAFQGNSGSPVFDRQTHEVIGILVSGNADYVWTGGCNINKTCVLPFCDGEKVVRTSQILSQLE
jgi:hypothetical protein